MNHVWFVTSTINLLTADSPLDAMKNLLMLFGKEFAEIYFPWLIMILDKSIIAEIYILMMHLHHQMITIKGPLHMIFVYNTLMHWCMILASTTYSPSPSPRSYYFRSFKWIRETIEDIFYHLFHVHFWWEVLSHEVFLLTSVTWTKKIML